MSTIIRGRQLSIDDLIHVVDYTVASAPCAVLIAAFSFWRSRNIYGPTVTFLDHLRAHKYLAYFLGWVLVKTGSRVLTRLVRNHGWKADPPRWSRNPGEGDVVLITGGSTGIGKEVVEMLAKKTNKIAVLDMAPPTYNASEFDAGTPSEGIAD